jgi:GNAT superfamily N-acetyltransferase
VTGWALRKAALADRGELEGLIARSARELSAGDYRPAQVEAALQGAFGVDTQLILDGTYYVAQAAGRIVGCGGWSRRRTLFGGDARAERDATLLDPRTDAARIRAFFVDPRWARRGIGAAILARCEGDAAGEGFRRLELMATLPGVRLYAARGFVAGGLIRYEMRPGVAIEFVPMSKTLEAAAPGRGEP